MAETNEFVCDTCGVPIDEIQVGLSKKLINRGTKIFWCADCLSKMSGYPKEVFPDMVVRFRRMGCTLFRPWTDADEAEAVKKGQTEKA